MEVLLVKEEEELVWDGDVHSEQEVQHHASELLVCSTVRAEWETPPTPAPTKHFSMLLTWGADHSPPLSPWLPKPLATYSVWIQNTSACLLIHYSKKEERGNSTVRPDTCKGLQSLYMRKQLERCSYKRTRRWKFRALSSQQPNRFTTPHPNWSMRKPTVMFVSPHTPLWRFCPGAPRWTCPSEQLEIAATPPSQTQGDKSRLQVSRHFWRLLLASFSPALWSDWWWIL